MSRITKTMQALLDARTGPSLAVTGARQAGAARSLVRQGLAVRYESQSRLVVGATFYDHFRRGYATRRPHADIGGILYFAE